ncbi:PH domain-containing protein [Gemmatimonas sp.]|uniref:PH domain-containing protein n=1 Tax=Gemmatimonas sp. TaxID=1962908 RepID=UPI00262073EF|nr:PH domain-containing protein [Gemmatimonas sp.]
MTSLDVPLQDGEPADAKPVRDHGGDAATEGRGQLALGIIFASFLLIAAMLILGSRPAKITVTPSSFSVRAAGYTSEIARSRIDSVRLTSKISGLGSKMGGFQGGSAYAGTFAMRPYGTVRLFVNVSRPPYVTIFSRDGVVMVNGATPAATHRLFADLTGTGAASPHDSEARPITIERAPLLALSNVSHA